MTSACIEVPIRIGNGQAVTEGNPAREVRRALTIPGRFGLPWLVAFCEVSPLEVSEVAGPLGYGTVQRGAPGSPRAGVALCHDREHATRLHVVRFKVGSPATSEGGGIRERGILTERYAFHDNELLSREVDASAIHNPPGRAGKAQADFMADVRRTTGLILGDFNEDVATMKRTTERQYRGIGVLGAIIPDSLAASKAWPVDIDSDHAGVDILVRIPLARVRDRVA